MGGDGDLDFDAGVANCHNIAIYHPPMPSHNVD
jgi:hypothetical protein